MSVWNYPKITFLILIIIFLKNILSFFFKIGWLSMSTYLLTQPHVASETPFLKHLQKMLRPKGMKLRLYQKYAQYWTITKRRITAGGIGIPYQIRTAPVTIRTMQDKNTMVVILLFLSNIALHWRFGPQRNMEEEREITIPRV